MQEALIKLGFYMNYVGCKDFEVVFDECTSQAFYMNYVGCKDTKNDKEGEEKQGFI